MSCAEIVRNSSFLTKMCALRVFNKKCFRVFEILIAVFRAPNIFLGLCDFSKIFSRTNYFFHFCFLEEKDWGIDPCRPWWCLAGVAYSYVLDAYGLTLLRRYNLKHKRPISISEKMKHLEFCETLEQNLHSFKEARTNGLWRAYLSGVVQIAKCCALKTNCRQLHRTK